MKRLMILVLMSAAGVTFADDIRPPLLPPPHFVACRNEAKQCVPKQKPPFGDRDAMEKTRITVETCIAEKAEQAEPAERDACLDELHFIQERFQELIGKNG